ncbi:MAG: alkaline phosphatase family protein [Pseudomonadota bacterium]
MIPPLAPTCLFALALGACSSPPVEPQAPRQLEPALGVDDDDPELDPNERSGRGRGRGRSRDHGGATEAALAAMYAGEPDPLDHAALVDLYARSLHPDWSGQVFLHLAPGHYVLDDDRDDSSDARKRGFHLSAYDWERHVPLLVYVPGDPSPGVRHAAVSLESVGATLMDVLGVPRPAGVTAPALQVPPHGDLKVVCVLVMDACPYWMWEHYLGQQPHFARLRALSREYDRALLDFMSSSTTVSHAALATGQPPARTGIPINHTRTAPGHYTEVFQGNDPERLLVPTAADLYDAGQGNRPVVVSFSSQSRAAIAMAGHGRSWSGGDADVVAWQHRYSGPMETNEEFYAPITYLAQVDARAMLMEHAGESFLGHRLQGERDLFRSPYNVEIGERAVGLAMVQEGVGDDGVTDLVLFNQKVLDNIAHRWGADTEEYQAGMDALDAFIGRWLETLHARAGDDFLLIVTSDHGFGPTLARPEEGSDPRRHERAPLQVRVEARLGTAARPVVEDVQYLNAYLDEAAMEASGHTLAEVCAAFTAEDWIVDCLVRDEVLARQAEILP